MRSYPERRVLSVYYRIHSAPENSNPSEKFFRADYSPYGTLLIQKLRFCSTKHQVDDILEEIRIRKKRRTCSVTTLTKKSSENLTSYLKDAGIR